MKILVTGCAGFIGTNLTKYLLDNNYEVCGIDNFNDYYSVKVKEYNILPFKNNENFRLERIDLLDVKALENVFETFKPSVIVHLAAWAGVTRSIKEPITYVRNNIEASVNLMELAVKYKIDNFIFASTSSIYGNQPTPFKETYSSDHPLAPYPATKKAVEVLLSTYSTNYNLNTSILRIFNPVGPNIRPDIFLPTVIRSCLYGIECPIYWTEEETKSVTARDYTYVYHMLEAIDTIIKNPFKYEIFNLGNANPVFLAEFLNTVEEVVGKPLNRVYKSNRKGEMISTYADISKAIKMLNYNPTTSLKETINIYYNWFMQQEGWYIKGVY